MKRIYKLREEAVSPVIGVMLMLVVTIIIAAVVSAFAGGITSGTQKAPSVAIDATIANTGGDHSYFDMHVMSGDPVNSKDLKLITTWHTTNKTSGSNIIGGNTTLPNVINTRYSSTRGSKTTIATRVLPYGYGPGVQTWGAFSSTNVSMYFGNYTLMPGTTLHAYPMGGQPGEVVSGYGVVTPYQYTYKSGGYLPDTSYWDGMQGTLGKGWENLRAGDIVNVQLLHIPSGKIILNDDVSVVGA